MPLDAAREVAQERAEDEREGPLAGNAGQGQESGGPRGVAKVRQDARLERDAPATGQTEEHEDEPESGHATDHRSGDTEVQGTDDVAHRRTRPSSGRRPIRTMSRYATRVRAPPARSTSVPVRVA